MILFWFRRDLRLDDNVGLAAALKESEKILPLFIFDANIISELVPDDSRITFIHDNLRKLNGELFQLGSSLATLHGTPAQIIEDIVIENKITAVYTNRDYEPYAIARDFEIEKMLQTKGIKFHSFKDHVVFEQNEIVKSDGLPYVVFTPYANKWKSELFKNPFRTEMYQFAARNFTSHSYSFLELEQIGFIRSAIVIPPPDISALIVTHYSQTRNFPAIGTSRLGPHLRFGTVSIRQIITIALKTENDAFLNELIWREFFMQILWHFPATAYKSFRPKYDAIRWRNDEREFQNWCDGQTGYPIVDAGMRELNATGFMHNRVRMIVASFLCKRLLIDWRWGEAYFATKLIDYELASNVGNWQWAAGSGVDAAPYFRIFNASEQVRKFDKKMEYISKWVPELNELTYPAPIVDHKEARERCLRAYRDALTD